MTDSHTVLACKIVVGNGRWRPEQHVTITTERSFKASRITAVASAAGKATVRLRLSNKE